MLFEALTHPNKSSQAEIVSRTRTMEGEARSEIPFRPKSGAIEQSNPDPSKDNTTASNLQNPKHRDSPKLEKEESHVKKRQGKAKGSSQNAGEKNTDTPAGASSSTITELPDFIVQRNKLFDELKHKRDSKILEKDHAAISVTLDLGVDNEGQPRPIMPVVAKAWESTPGSFLRHVDRDVSSDVVIAKVDNRELWDLDRPLEYACQVKYLPFASAEGRNVFWHSSAHVLGEAAECQYQCLLSHGPPVEQGFFYDMALPEG